MGENFTLDDIEQLDIKMATLFSNTDEMSVCFFAMHASKSEEETCARAKAWTIIVPKLAVQTQTIQ